MDEEKETEKNPHAAALSAMGASKGGKARAKKLSQEERSAIARKAAEKRWDMSKGDVFKATHQGVIRIEGVEDIECANLEDKRTRVLSRATFIRAIGRTGKAKGGRKYDDESRIPVFLNSPRLKPLINKVLTENSRPIVYRPVGGGLASIGYRAELLPLVCNVFIDADNLGLLDPTQKHIAERCRILRDGLAVVGITALVDEATGFQRDRTADALARILEEFVAKELRKWVRTFPDEFYREMFRLRRLKYGETVKKPQYIGHLTNDVVYSRLAPGVLAELRTRNPVLDSGSRGAKHFQWLTPDSGHPKLIAHLSAVIALMKAADSWSQFKVMVDRALPVYKPLPLFEDDNGAIQRT